MHPFGLTDAEFAVIQDKLAEKKTLAQGRSEVLFGVLDEALNRDERAALEFLFAFIPLVDLADYSGDLFLKHVRDSLSALKEAPWGHKITGQLYLHYVLPYRISNETIEDYRQYFWNELFHRVKHLSMADAILEVNHWCHEKATYIASDPRTASPLALIRTARGRCGEESALLVAALRSLGIPARQVYTPRWAHTDSNHAWVEAWADGTWYFLGACEPEPRLNMGWFEGPARRAMLLHTRVPGTIYAGPEEIVQAKDDYTELNLLTNYAPGQSLTVQVKDLAGRAVEGADVELQVFNYGGFSSLVRLQTDEQGEIKITTGRGDLLIHAVKDQLWGSALAQGDGPRLVEVVLGAERKEFQEFTMHAPPERPQDGIQVSAEERAENDRRLKAEDEIRAAYEGTFVSQAESELLAARLGVEPQKVWAVLENARGNSHAIFAYLEQAVPEYGPLALELAHILAAKDLTDTTGEILLDHLTGALPFEKLYPREEFFKYVLQPRVSHEILRGYRQFFQEQFSQKEQETFRTEPLKLKEWIEANIKTAENGAVRGWPSPQGIFELGVGNQLAKEILFVAMARSFGAAARLSPVDGKVQYLVGDKWVQVDSEHKTAAGRGAVRIQKPGEYSGKISYFQNFSLARLEEGVFRTLRFRGLDEEAFDEENFSYRLELEAGDYRLTSGNRLASGNVLVALKDFTVLPGEDLDIKLVFNQDEAEQSETLGRLPAGITLQLFTGGELALDVLKGDGPVVAAWIDPDREPTKHLIRDLEERKDQFEALSVPIILCLGEDKITDSFDPANYRGLPALRLVRDADYRFLAQVQESLQVDLPADFPMVLAADGQGTVRYVSAGYQIGTGSHILDCLQKG